MCPKTVETLAQFDVCNRYKHSGKKEETAAERGGRGVKFEVMQEKVRHTLM
jgi:hypothetical protein